MIWTAGRLAIELMNEAEASSEIMLVDENGINVPLTGSDFIIRNGQLIILAVPVKKEEGK